MNLTEWQIKKSQIEKTSGPWLSYELEFDGSAFFFKPTKDYQPLENIYLARILQIARDFLRNPLQKTRILDLACMEGLSSFEFALKGAKEVVGIEGRPVHVLKANAVKEALALNNINFFCDDVRNINKQKYGTFDLTLCLGIFYHLDSPDIFNFAEKMFEMTDSIAVIDTQFSFHSNEEIEYNGIKYYGGFAREDWLVSKEVRLNYGFEASLDNLRSFWLTKHSFLNLLMNMGFHSIYECDVPRGGFRQSLDDRLTIIALKNPFEKLVTLVDPEDKRVENFEKKDFNVSCFSAYQPPRINPDK